MALKKEVFDKPDEEKMADYGHSRAYKIMPHFNDNLDSQRKNDYNSESSKNLNKRDEDSSVQTPK